MNPAFIAFLSIVVSVAAQFLLKAGVSGAPVKLLLAQPFSVRVAAAVLSNPFVAGGLVLYGLGALLWLSVLAKWDVSKAYPMVGLGFAMTLAVGFLLGENVTGARVVGIVFICAGVALVGRS